MRFKDILGQTQLKRQLINTVNEQRVSHAQLFLSTEGSGALPLAVAYAQYLNCLERTPEDSCGTCSSCRKYEKYIHPDLHFSYPFFSSKDVKVAVDVLDQWRAMLLDDPYFDMEIWRSRLQADNKQANINIAECHDIIKKLSFKAFEARTKVLIMWLPEYLDKEGNALLKLIEEPPENTLFILVAQNQEQILTTLLSRTQIIKIPPIENSVIEHFFAEAMQNDDQILENSFLANGNLIEVKRLIEQTQNENAHHFTEWLRLAYSNSVPELIIFSESIAGWGRENQKNFIKYGINFLRECCLLINEAYILVKLPIPLKEIATKLIKVIDQRALNAIIAELEKAHYHVERNANPKILFLDVSLQLIKIIKFKSFSPETQYI